MQSEVDTLSEDFEPEKAVRAPIFAEMKDPLRCYEKALDEYGGRFDDGELPESCLTDVLRCRIPCKTGTQIHQLVQRFTEGFAIEVRVAKLPRIAPVTAS